MKHKNWYHNMSSLRDGNTFDGSGFSTDTNGSEMPRSTVVILDVILYRTLQL